MKAVPSPNYSSRLGHPVEAVVVHVSVGTMASMDDWFRNSSGKRAVSAHYGISRSGDEHWYVLEKFAAWHAGLKVNPRAPLVLEKGAVSPNLYTIGIEHEGSGTTDFTSVQYERSSALIADIARRHGFEISKRTVIPHRDIRADKSCPGPIDLDKLIVMAQRKLAPIPGSQVYSGFLDSNLTLVHWVGDNEWYYTVNRDPLKFGIVKATTPWSAMAPPQGDSQ